MLTLRDGPAKGAYMCQRAPHFLRAVGNIKTGKFDVLDQLNDEADAGEHIVDIYRRLGDVGQVHINTGSRKGGGYSVMAAYERVKEMIGVEIEHLRDTATWRQWCSEAQRNGKETRD